MTKLTKFKHIFIESYGGFNIYVTRCSRDYYSSLVKKEFGENAPEKNQTVRATTEIYKKNNVYVGVLWFDKRIKRHSEIFQLIVHETFHLIHWFLKDRGMWLNDASEEAYAYLLEEFCEKIRAIIFNKK